MFAANIESLGLDWCSNPFSSVADPRHFGADPDLRIHANWLMDPEPDPEPAIFIIDLQDANKKHFKKVFLLTTFWRYIYIFFQR